MNPVVGLLSALFCFVWTAAGQVCDQVPVVGNVVCSPRQGECIKDTTVGMLEFYTDLDRGARELQQTVKVYEHASYCQCKPGWTGLVRDGTQWIACNESCPSVSQGTERTACSGRHVQPRVRKQDESRGLYESCGQWFHRIPECRSRRLTGHGVCDEREWAQVREEWLLYNYTWALPEMCYCTWPWVGPACEWRVIPPDGDRDGHIVHTPTFQDMYRRTAQLSAEYRQGDPTRFMYDGPTRPPDDYGAEICGPHGRITPSHCECDTGWFPSNLRVYYTDDGDRRSKTDWLKRGFSALPQNQGAWTFAQLPMCSIRAADTKDPRPSQSGQIPRIDGDIILRRLHLNSDQDHESTGTDGEPTSLPAEQQRLLSWLQAYRNRHPNEPDSQDLNHCLEVLQQPSLPATVRTACQELALEFTRREEETLPTSSSTAAEPSAAATATQAILVSQRPDVWIWALSGVGILFFLTLIGFGVYHFYYQEDKVRRGGHQGDYTRLEQEITPKRPKRK